MSFVTFFSPEVISVPLLNSAKRLTLGVVVVGAGLGVGLLAADVEAPPPDAGADDATPPLGFQTKPVV